MTEYPTRIDEFNLGKWGKMKFKQWLFNNYPLEFDEKYFNQIAERVPVGSFAIDIGGYTGDTAIPMSYATGPTGKVLVFEPGPVSFKFLVENLELNDIRNVDPYQRAITDKDGSYTFHYVDDGFINGGYSSAIEAGPEGCGNKHEVQVVGVNLTGFLNDVYAMWLPKLSYVKIDSEGYDKEILKSNKDLFVQYKPTIQLEVYPWLSINERWDLIESIYAIGYSWGNEDTSEFFKKPPAVVDVVCRFRS